MGTSKKHRNSYNEPNEVRFPDGWPLMACAASGASTAPRSLQTGTSEEGARYLTDYSPLPTFSCDATLPRLLDDRAILAQRGFCCGLGTVV